MNLFIRQKKNLKARETQAQTATTESKASDSGYGGMDSREDPATSEAVKSKAIGSEGISQVAQHENESSVKSRASTVNDERPERDVKKNLKSEQRSKTKDNGRAESADRHVCVFVIILCVSRQGFTYWCMVW